MKAIVLIFIALTIDALQALITFGLFVLATFGGTVAGGAVGCAAGAKVAGQIGCWVGGTVLGFFGTFANPALAPVLTPIGVVLGFAVNICLSMTLGAGLLLLLWHFGMLYPRYLWGGLAEIIPGIDCLPFWTVLVVMSLIRKSAEEKTKGITSAAAGLAMFAFSPGSKLAGMAKGVMGIRRENASMAMESNPQSFGRMNAEVQQGQEEGDDEPKRAARVVLQNVDGIQSRQPKTSYAA